jgi:hypothetical protein
MNHRGVRILTGSQQIDGPNFERRRLFTATTHKALHQKSMSGFECERFFGTANAFVQIEVRKEKV